ncbi:MAG: polyprenyl synthetase family protein [Arenicellales bacterium]
MNTPVNTAVAQSLVQTQDTLNTKPSSTRASNALLANSTELLADELNAVNRLIRDEMNSDIALINTLGEYIIQSGGKRLRPLILLLSARALGYTDQHHITLAAVIEFIHTATLLHDDVVDASTLRRGNPTANDVWGNEASVLVGDFLYSRSFEMMVKVGKMQVMELMSVTTNAIAEGEVMQLLNAHVAETTEAAYLETIYRKTACLFESSAQLGGILADTDATMLEALGKYGKHLGNAFQLVDDLLDYQASSEEMGKNTGDDLAEGKPTLPLIEAMRRGTPEQISVIKTAIELGQVDKIDEVLAIVTQTGALEYTELAAQSESQAAIDALGDIAESEYKTALIDLALFSTYRTY